MDNTWEAGGAGQTCKRRGRSRQKHKGGLEAVSARVVSWEMGPVMELGVEAEAPNPKHCRRNMVPMRGHGPSCWVDWSRGRQRSRKEREGL